MNIFTSGTELTTAITDAVIAMLSVYIMFRLKIIEYKNNRMKKIWNLFFLCLFIASTLGFIIHGFILNSSAINVLWYILSFVFCIVLTLLLIVSIYEINNKIKKKYVISIIVFSMLVYVTMFIFALLQLDFLKVYILFVAISMILSTTVFLIMLLKYKKINNIYFLLGILFQIIGGLVLYNRQFYIKLLLKYDYNSFYHVTLLFTLYFFYLGNKKRINMV